MAKKHHTPGLTAALERVPPPRLAEILGVTPEAVYQWRKMPLGRVHDVQRATGLPLHVLRPDFFERPRRKGRGELRA